MNTFAVTVDGAPPPSVASGATEIVVRTAGPHPNLHFRPEGFAATFLRDIRPIAEDLLLLGTAVYAADARAQRGTARDAFADQWYREFCISMPVTELEVWREPELQESLADALHFLTGDRFSFDFHQKKKPRPQQLQLAGQDPPSDIKDADTVVMLSGGLDSLLAAVAALDEGRRPLTVGHRPATQIHSRQKRILELLRERRPSWSFPHIGVTITSVAKERTSAAKIRPKEFSQRSRSFLFACLGAVACTHIGVYEMRLCDNGVVSLNLPQSGQNIGTMLSRSTHPGYLERVQRFISRVFKEDIRIINTLLHHTKRDVVEEIRTRLGPEIIQETVSCARTEGRTKGQPHCGVCTQCVDRRFATASAGLEEYDLPVMYEKDIFRCDLAEGEDRTHVENYVRFAQTLEGLGDAEAFAQNYLSELLEACPWNVSPQERIEHLWDVFNKHQKNVNQVLEELIRRAAPDMRRGVLPENSLLRLLAVGAHLRDPRGEYVRRLGRLLKEALPKAFVGTHPENEAAMQRVGDAVLSASGETLHREFPVVPFAGIGVRPDFSSPGDSLWVEFKLIKHRNKRSKVSDEIAADIVKYEVPSILFVVYDAVRAISDDSEFASTFEAKGRGRVFVTIVR